MRTAARRRGPSNAAVARASKSDSRFSVVQLDEQQVALLERCVAEAVPLLAVKPEIRVMGRPCRQQRNVGFFSDDSEGYRYSGQLAASIPLSPSLRPLLAAVNAAHGTDFNGILVNQYCDGTDYLSAHSDDERHLSGGGTVVGISYGAERVFRIRTKERQSTTPRHPIVADVVLASGAMYSMTGADFQKEFTHEIPRQASVPGGRVSFTFRKHDS